MAFEKTMEKIVSLSKNRGFIFRVPRFYDGLANTWDYGPLGVELKNNVKNCGGRNLSGPTPTMSVLIRQY